MQFPVLRTAEIGIDQVERGIFLERRFKKAERSDNLEFGGNSTHGRKNYFMRR